MARFELIRQQIDLRKGAWPGGWRSLLKRDGRTVLGFTQGHERAYLYPVLTPAGALATSEHPADHPHHNSVWIAADHVNVVMPTSEAVPDEGTYNFYVNEVFQGRAPGCIRETAIEGEVIDDEAFRVVQSLDWRGPGEWGVAVGRVLAQERRATELHWHERGAAIDIVSEMAATDWDLEFGPTRHAWFGVRVAETMSVTEGGRLIDAAGRNGGTAITGQSAPWIDLTGQVGGGRKAGIAVFPDPGTAWDPWFATDWGTVAVNPIQRAGRTLARGEKLRYRLRLVVHDGLAPADIAVAYKDYKQECGA